ncbi:hypothetical protein ZWY2020_058301 [Hordeum vulgare]|nr:hypothetical protein ZWY2020_058301 [Hordeum vulgare]
MDFQPGSQTRLVDLSGTPDHISKAEQLISDVLAEADAGSFGTIPNWKYNAPQPSVEQFQMQIANNKVILFHLPPGDISTERTLYIDDLGDREGEKLRRWANTTDRGMMLSNVSTVLLLFPG